MVDYEEYIKNMDEFIKSVFFEMFNIGVFRVVDVLSEMLGYLVMIEVF